LTELSDAGGLGIQERYPLTPLQHGMLLQSLLAPALGVNVLQAVCRFREPLDVDRLERAWRRVVARHGVLRTRFRWDDAPEPMQEVVAGVPVEIARHDGAGVALAEREEALARYLAEDRARGFDLAEAPAMRLALFHGAGDDECVLVWSVHHVLLDLWSLTRVLGEVLALYDAGADGAEAALPVLRPFRDHVRWLRERDAAADEAYWTGVFEGLEAPAPMRPIRSAPRDPRAEPHFGARELRLSPAADAALRALKRDRGVFVNTVVQGAWALLLGRYTGSTEAVFGTVRHGRATGLEGAEGMVGLLINTVAMRVPLPPEARVVDWLAEVAARNAALGPHQHAALPDLQRWSGLPQGAPLFDTLVNYQPLPFEAAFRGTEGRSVSLREHPGYPLALGVDAEEPLRACIHYDTDLFDAAAVDRMLGHFARLLEAMAAGPERPLGSLDLLGEAERAVVLEEWNRTEAEYPADRCIHELFEAQVARTPGAVAVRVEEESLTYRELDARANRLAHHLRRRGVGPEVRVGVLVERSPALIAAVLGVLKAGAAYVPLDPAYPAERLRYVLEDSGARVLVTGDGVEAALAGAEVDSFAVVDLDAEAEAIDGEPETPPVSGVHPQNLAYVIHTSGSTGRPKGTGVPHRSLVSSTRARTAWYGADPERFLLLSSIAFDSSVAGMFWTLCGGGALHLMPGEAHTEPAEVVRRMGEQGITDLLCVPSYYAALLRFVEGPLPSLARAIVAGEAATWELAARHGALFPHTQLVNEYGPTEATVWSTAYRCPPDAAGAAVIPIGGPIPNARAYVVDGHGHPAPVGVVGELWVGGAGVTRGYLGRPGLTAERFVPDPFSGEAGARLYRTGDRVRWRMDGVIEFLGRLDHQVKVRGFRIELGEIEAVLRRHESVADCAVVAREDETGDRRLVAYVVGEAEADALRAHVRRSLPEYMLPSAFVSLDALPLTPNGKLDRKALPAPEYAADADRYVAPRTPTEEVLAEIWAEVLRIERVGAHESFFALGGHSLLATGVTARVRAVFAVELPPRALFESTTVAALAVRVEEMRRADLPVLPPVVPTGRTGALPLSFAQERLWFLDRLEPGSAVYNIPVAWRLGGALEEPALERALGEIVRRHESLRTVFAEVDGSPVQVIAPFGGFALPVEDLSGLSEADREAALRHRVAEEARRPFDLSAGPLFRAALLRVDEEDHVLLLSMHHVVSDGWSMGVLFRELSALYAAYLAGGESPLPELAVQYADYAVWQREQLGGEVLDRQLSYWTERLAGAPELLELPMDRPRPPARTYQGAAVPVSYSPELLERLQALGRSEGATLYMTLLGAFQVLLSRYGGGEDIVVGSPIAGRTRREVEELIGFFVNTLVLRTDLSGDPTFRAVLRRVREVTLGAYEHQEVPFEKLVAELRPERSLSHSPLFQVMFTLQNTEGEGGALAGLEASSVGAAMEIAKFDLSLTLSTTPQGLRGALNYSTDLFEPDTITRMVGHLERLLEQVAADADARLSRLDLLSEAERSTVVEEWNRTAAAYPGDRCIHRLFEAHAARTPEAVAVVCEDRSLTFGALNARANQLAHHLRCLGVGPDAVVAMHFGRGVDAIVALLGILKAGGAYLALDPALPPERLAYMLEDSAAAVLVTRGDMASAVPAGSIPVVHLGGEALRDESGADLPGGAGAADLAYVVYTSGSTGRPKGVAVEHRQISNYLFGLRDRLELAEGAGYATVSTLSADLGNTVVFSALAWGGTLHVISDDRVLNGDLLGQYFARHGVDCLKITPSHLAALQAGGDPRRVMPRRWLVLGGESSPVRWVDELVAMAPECAVFNHYGPTETTVGALAHRAGGGRTETASGTLVLGRPLPNYQVFVVDAHLRPVPAGVAGELLVGGAGVARGYLGRPGMTAERFVASPFGEGRLYRTGDRCRWLADGTVEFLGRMDQQVKIRGFRVELGEIEAALRQDPGVAECAVVAREDVPGEPRLVAYLVGGADADGLRAGLRRTLPEHMVPAAFVVLDRLPLTPNGKLDRGALPAPEPASEGRYVAPRTPTEEVLAEIWAEVLRLERVGVEDNFFALGGHSLLLMRLLAHIQATFDLEISIRAVFSLPTLEAMAGEIERRIYEDVDTMSDDQAEQLVASNLVAVT